MKATSIGTRTRSTSRQQTLDKLDLGTKTISSYYPLNNVPPETRMNGGDMMVTWGILGILHT